MERFKKWLLRWLIKDNARPVKWCHQCPFGLTRLRYGCPTGVECQLLQRSVQKWDTDAHIPPTDCPLRKAPVLVELAN